jgi:hypothetical protein
VRCGAQLEGLGRGRDDAEQGGDLVFGRARVGTSQAGLELGTAAPLTPAHAPAAAQLGVGEAVEEVAVGADREVEGGGVVLAVLERDEAVDDQRLAERAAGTMELVEQQAVAAQAGGLGGDGGG